MKNLEKLTNIIEAIVFVSGDPIEIKDISEKLEVEEDFILLAIKELQKKYVKSSGLQLLTFNKKLQYITVAQNGVFDDITITLREDRNEELGEIDEYN